MVLKDRRRYGRGGRGKGRALDKGGKEEGKGKRWKNGRRKINEKEIMEK